MKYKNIKVGDLIWSKMPLPFYKLIFIKKDHRKRPYLIIKKNLFKIIGIPCTSNMNTFISNKKNYILNHNKYNLPSNKDSLLIIYKPCKIKKRLLEDKIATIKKDDLNKIIKLYKENLK